MKKYRKKPIEVEAIQWTGHNRNEVELFAGKSLILGHDLGVFLGCLEIPTLEGIMKAQAGDWIIRGIKRELYPCKADIFAATYDEVKP